MFFKFPVYPVVKPFDIMVEQCKVIIIVIIIVIIVNDSGDHFNGTKLDSICPCVCSALVCFAHCS